MLIGPLPTPGIAYMTRRFECNFGVVISASHNLYDDNGIKFFDASGAKLSDELEEQIELELERGPVTRTSRSLGRASRVDKSRVHYQEFCASTLPHGIDLTGLKIVVDCANGAAYKVGPRVLADLGADIVPIGCSPNGRNINDGCGSQAPDLLQLTVPGVRAGVGIALDGDGDRLAMVDHLGRLVDGDQLLYVIASARARDGSLRGPVVGTVMSNLGLELALREQSIEFHRAAVGDRYVLSLLRETGGILGGETSGHILCLDKTTTGDALVSALQVLAVMKQTGQTLAALAAGMQRFPQVLLNVKVSRRFEPKNAPHVQEAIARIEAQLAEQGRVVLRASGTEPVIRVMVEGRDEGATRAYATELADAVRAAAPK
jgi:phosphoglucosamine mutase